MRNLTKMMLALDVEVQEFMDKISVQEDCQAEILHVDLPDEYGTGYVFPLSREFIESEKEKYNVDTFVSIIRTKPNDNELYQFEVSVKIGGMSHTQYRAVATKELFDKAEALYTEQEAKASEPTDETEAD